MLKSTVAVTLIALSLVGQSASLAQSQPPSQVPPGVRLGPGGQNPQGPGGAPLGPGGQNPQGPSGPPLGPGGQNPQVPGGKPLGPGGQSPQNIEFCGKLVWGSLIAAKTMPKDQVPGYQCETAPVNYAEKNGFPSNHPRRAEWISGCKTAVQSAIASCTEKSSDYGTCVSNGIGGLTGKIKELNQTLKQNC